MPEIYTKNMRFKLMWLKQINCVALHPIFGGLTHYASEQDSYFSALQGSSIEDGERRCRPYFRSYPPFE